jgi:hypothetical protein
MLTRGALSTDEGPRGTASISVLGSAEGSSSQCPTASSMALNAALMPHETAATRHERPGLTGRGQSQRAKISLAGSIGGCLCS